MTPGSGLRKQNAAPGIRFTKRILDENPRNPGFCVDRNLFFSRNTFLDESHRHGPRGVTGKSSAGNPDSSMRL